MKLYIYCILSFLFLVSCKSVRPIISSKKPQNKVTIDLVNIINDKVSVSFTPNKISTETTVFYMPKIVPGTYSNDNYGKFISGLKAYGKDNEPLPVTKLDDNSWEIKKAKSLSKITYNVEDTFDIENTHDVFSPSGTNILKDTNFILNLHGFVGYFKESQQLPYILSIKHPSKLKAATSHDAVLGINPKLIIGKDEAIDTFYYTRYASVTDDPIMYGELDNETFEINGIEVLVSVYSPNKIHSAKKLVPAMKKMMLAQKNFMGAINSTKKYSILLYLSTLNSTDASGFGALEHNNSTVVVLPESMPLKTLEDTMIDVVSHEFFHIIAPLTIHSEEIHNFDYYQPKMSKHLWLYEGTTEYFAQLFQVKQSLITYPQFFERIVKKIRSSGMFDNSMSFTKMSENILEDPYKSNYANVYEKGALISMCIDIIILEKSEGEKGILDLMKSLASKYGANKPFVDSELIDIVVGMTYPEVGEFLDKHVVKGIPINYADYFDKVGLEYGTETVKTAYFKHNSTPYISPNQEANEVFFNTSGEYNSFLKSLEIEPKDILVAINDQKIDLNNASYIFEMSQNWKAGDSIAITIRRNGEEMVKKTVLSEDQPTSLKKVLIQIPGPSLTVSQFNTKRTWLY